MLLKSIKLENIRSYLSQKIDFGEGSVMLSGDIGSGKSTILLAIEFGLFGIMKGDVSGESLLRNGKKEGSVELCVELNGREVMINRVLKRSSQGVKQEAGYVIVNGVKKTGTSTELKAMILEMLGYPKELLTKSKGLIYRYTVFTPQEEMKKILFEDKEARLNTLRRVFDVDKYKRIRENAKTYIYELKGKVKEIEGAISDLEEKKKHFSQRAREISEIEERIEKIKPALESAKKDVKGGKKQLSECEKAIEKLSLLKKELAVCEAELRNLLLQRERNNSEIERIKDSVEKLQKEVGEADGMENISLLVKEKENALKYMHDTKLKISQKIAETSSKIGSSRETKEKISKLDSCPLCLQDVSHDHKKQIIGKENEKSAELEEDLKINKAQDIKADNEIRKIMAELDVLRKKERVVEALRVKQASLKDNLKQIGRLEAEQEKIKKEIGAVNAKKMKASSEIEGFSLINERYQELRKEFEEAEKKERDLMIENNTFETEKKGKLAMIEELKFDIDKKEKAKGNLQGIRDLQHWIDTHFISLMALMEKQVMAKVYHSFNELFKSWFEMLMDDEAISSRLDDSFTPVVVQNGYETSLDYLSGGEKTSCALAYRLSLNRVINDLITTIHTKDLIILDEPTDGFSTEQLDRVREVIDQLNMRQVLIVSHEQKVEGFVDKVIRISKNEHVSTAA